MKIIKKLTEAIEDDNAVVDDVTTTVYNLFDMRQDGELSADEYMKELKQVERKVRLAVNQDKISDEQASKLFGLIKSRH